MLTKFMVVSLRGVAVRHGDGFGAGWLLANPMEPPPPHLLTWDTADGARKFAGMNGGTVITVTEYFYSPRQAAVN